MEINGYVFVLPINSLKWLMMVMMPVVLHPATAIQVVYKRCTVLFSSLLWNSCFPFSNKSNLELVIDNAQNIASILLWLNNLFS